MLGERQELAVDPDERRRVDLQVQVAAAELDRRGEQGADVHGPVQEVADRDDALPYRRRGRRTFEQTPPSASGSLHCAGFRGSSRVAKGDRL